jgi:hypothetical protein
MITNTQKDLFKRVRAELGAPVRKVEVTDDQLCQLLENATQDYAERVQAFITESNWANLYGKNLSNIDLAWALSVRTFDLAKDYSFYFSKEVGLQTRGTKFELKKDFFKLECGRQVYTIPAGREINKVMWLTPPTTDVAMWANYGGLGVSFGGGVTGQMGLGTATAFGGMGSAYGMGVGIWALPAYDIALMAADLKTKNEFLRSDLTYKVTAGPNGTHLIHLMSTPGSPLTFGMSGRNMYSLNNCTCWYTYYDVNGNEDECRKNNIGDILLSPDQIPLEKMDYEYLNAPTQNIVRKLLTAKAARTLSFIRGKFSGQLNTIASPLTMDYSQFSTYADKLEDKTLEDLDKRLENLSPYKVMENQANLVENMIKVKKGTPLPLMVI